MRVPVTVLVLQRDLGVGMVSAHGVEPRPPFPVVEEAPGLAAQAKVGQGQLAGHGPRGPEELLRRLRRDTGVWLVQASANQNPGGLAWASDVTRGEFEFDNYVGGEPAAGNVVLDAFLLAFTPLVALR